MKHRWRQGLAGVLAALMMTTSAGAVGATIEIDGTSLSSSEAWIKNGISYVTLAAFCRETGRTLSWTGTAARIDGGGLDLEAAFGATYVQSNGRVLYMGEEVQVVNGRSALSLRTLANASGAQLTWDWDTATASLNTKGAVPPQADYDQEDLYWLSRIIYAESGNQSLEGKIAVGNVVLNRVASPQFPNSVYSVIFQRNQFTPASNGRINRTPTAECVIAAKLAMEGTNTAGNALYFINPSISSSRWFSRNCTYVATIGAHAFFA